MRARAVLFLLTALAVLPLTQTARAKPAENASAQPAANPAALHGRWAMPSCGAKIKSAMIYTRHFTLLGYDDRYLIRPAPAIVEKEGGILHFPYAQRPYDVKTDGPDRLLYLDDILSKLAGPGDHDPFNDREYRYMLMRYARCPELPGLDADGLDALSRLDTVAEACAANGAPCHAALFAAFDTNGSGGLDDAELRQAYRRTQFLIAGTSCAVRFPGDSAEAAPAFARAALSIADGDRDGALTAAEIKTSWQALAATPETAKYLKLGRMASVLVPALPAPAPTEKEEEAAACLCSVPASPAAAQTPPPDKKGLSPLLSLPPLQGSPDDGAAAE